jgi:CheY-like chemotaxis protein
MARVLIVDDEIDSIEPLARFLQSRSHEVARAPNGREALLAVSTTPPEVIILDLRMPRVDGVSFLQIIRSYLRWQNLPVIVYTAFSEGIDAQRAMQMGVEALLRKPQATFEQVAEAIDQALRKPRDPLT